MGPAIDVKPSTVIGVISGDRAVAESDFRLGLKRHPAAAVIRGFVVGDGTVLDGRLAADEHQPAAAVAAQVSADGGAADDQLP